MNENNRVIILKEHVNKSKLCYIIHNPNLYGLGEVVNDTTLLKQLKEYYYSLDEHGYKTVQYRQNNGMGRYYSEGYTISKMKKIIRNTIVKDCATDVDIENCHYRLMSYYCHSNSIECIEIDDYINNRDSKITNLSKELNIDKNEAKLMLLSILNGKSYMDLLKKFPKWTLSLINEVKDIKERVIELNPKLLEKAIANNEEKKKTYNHKATALSYLLHNLENKFIMVIYDYMTQYVKIDSLIYDGFHINTSSIGDIDINQLIDDCMKYLKNEHNINLVLKIKPMDYCYTITEEDLKRANIQNGVISILNPDGTYDSSFLMEEDIGYLEFKHKWEQIAVFLTDAGVYCIRDKRGKYSYFDEGELVKRYKQYTAFKLSAKSYKKDGTVKEIYKPISFIKVWIVDKYKHTRDFMELRPPPLKPLRDTFNTWEGFYLENQDEYIGDSNSDYVNLWMWFIKTLFKTDNFATYIHNWIASIVQKPGIKPTGGSLVLYSEAQGSGKNTFCDGLKAIIGSKYAFETSNPSRDLYGTFNKDRLNKLLIIIDEVSAKESFSNNGKIKALTVEPSFTVNDKHKSTYTAKCLSRFVFTTNNIICLNIPPEDRRFVVQEVSNELVGNVECFNKLYKMFNNTQAMTDIFTFYKNYDITIDIVNERPKTALYDLMKKANIIPFNRWIADYIKNLDSNELVVDPDDIGKPREVVVASKKLYKNYTNYLEECGYKNIPTDKAFYKDLNTIYEPSFNTYIDGIEKKIIHKVQHIKFKIDTAMPLVEKWLVN